MMWLWCAVAGQVSAKKKQLYTTQHYLSGRVDVCISQLLRWWVTKYDKRKIIKNFFPSHNSPLFTFFPCKGEKQIQNFAFLITMLILLTSCKENFTENGSIFVIWTSLDHLWLTSFYFQTLHHTFLNWFLNSIELLYPWTNLLGA